MQSGASESVNHQHLSQSQIIQGGHSPPSRTTPKMLPANLETAMRFATKTIRTVLHIMLLSVLVACAEAKGIECKKRHSEKGIKKKAAAHPSLLGTTCVNSFQPIGLDIPQATSIRQNFPQLCRPETQKRIHLGMSSMEMWMYLKN